MLRWDLYHVHRVAKQPGPTRGRGRRGGGDDAVSEAHLLLLVERVVVVEVVDEEGRAAADAVGLATAGRGHLFAPAVVVAVVVVVVRVFSMTWK